MQVFEKRSLLGHSGIQNDLSIVKSVDISATSLVTVFLDDERNYWIARCI